MKLIFLLLIAAALVIGVCYIRAASDFASEAAKKRRLVKENRRKYGVSNRGASMDDASTDVLPYEQLGIWE